MCCSDGEHCCPKGYNCDTAQAICVHESSVIPWSTKQPAFLRNRDMKSLVPRSELCHCMSDQTCCTTGHGYGCCPFENVCSFCAIMFIYEFKVVKSPFVQVVIAYVPR